MQSNYTVPNEIDKLRQRVVDLTDQRDSFARVVGKLQTQLLNKQRQQQLYWCQEHGEYWYNERPLEELAICPTCEQHPLSQAEEECYCDGRQPWWEAR